MTHYFESPIDLQSTPSRSGGPRSGEKRKREPDHAVERAADDSAHSSAEEVEPDDEDDLPPDFPHAPFRDSSRLRRARPAAVQRNLKTQHFHVLNTILHRCLLEHDWKRAATAFGALLRFEMNGRRADVRRHGLWLIGASLLLSASDFDAADQVDDGAGIDNFVPVKQHSNPTGGTQRSAAVFKAAREYFDRLIVQYPYRKNRPLDTSSRDFYPAMFSMWILQIQAESHSRSGATSTSPLGPRSVGNGDDDDYGKPEPPRHGRDWEAKSAELAQARGVASALEALTGSPPLDRHPDLLLLQARTNRWMADLVRATARDDAEYMSLSDKARRAFRKARNENAKLSADELELLAEDDSTISRSP